MTPVFSNTLRYTVTNCEILCKEEMQIALLLLLATEFYVASCKKRKKYKTNYNLLCTEFCIIVLLTII